MSYSNMSTNQQRVHLTADGFRETLYAGGSEMREAMRNSDIASNAGRFSDPYKNVLRFAIFLSAAKFANLKPEHVVHWLGRSWEGNQAIRNYAVASLKMAKSS